MTLNAAIVVALVSLIISVAGGLVTAWITRPKTKAEADKLNAAASVSMSQEARAWTQLFVDRANVAEQHADAAERKADEAEHRAEAAEERIDELEASLIECYGYVRLLREHYRQHGETPPPLPVRLEALWRANGRD